VYIIRRRDGSAFLVEFVDASPPISTWTAIFPVAEISVDSRAGGFGSGGEERAVVLAMSVDEKDATAGLETGIQ
jgi:hypothetical protein